MSVDNDPDHRPPEEPRDSGEPDRTTAPSGTRGRRRYRITALGAATVVGAGLLSAYVWNDARQAHRPLGNDDPAAAPSFTAGASSETPSASSSPSGAQARAAQTAVARPTDVPAKVIDLGSIKDDRKTLRIVTAHGDLTGQRELAWVTDPGYAVGRARCTQNFKIGQDAAARKRPTMLLCWRTSPSRSVYTIAVDLTGPPSEKESVAALTKAWNELG